MTEDYSKTNCNHALKVKVRSGGSIVKVKPVFSYDSKYLLVGRVCDIRVFSIVSGECVLTFRGHEKPIVSIQPNKKNKLQVLSCCEGGTVILWDYTGGEILQKYDLNLKNIGPIISAFYCPSANGPWFAITQLKKYDHHRLYSLTVKGTRISEVNMIMKPVYHQENSVSFGPESCYVAGIIWNTLQTYDFQSKSHRQYKSGKGDLTCVACHPSEYIIATGDSDGRIIVWSGALGSNNPTRTIYHWHSSSLSDLVFSSEGAHIYSGGNEAALVRWNLNSDSKQILPRLGLAICRVTNSPDNVYIATSHVDNALQIINSQNIVVQIIQGLSQGHCQSTQKGEIVPTGLLYDTRSAALVMNGRPGHLQFYNLCNDTQLFQLDIVGRNFICQEKDSLILNTDVEKAAIHNSGLWLATVECRDDGETSLEMHLKFWQYNVTSQKFSLNTNIFLPHNKKVNCLKFQPEVSVESYGKEHMPLAVTTSDDDRFKIWSLNEDEKKRLSWSCELMGYYKDLPACDACFSEDGSLLAVVFDFIITLWDPETNILKGTLSDPNDFSPVRRVVFGANEHSHLLVCHTDKKITIWNVLTLSVLWSVKCDVECLTIDPISGVVASFIKDGYLVFFKPSNPKPESVMKEITISPVIAAIFIPHLKSHSQKPTNQQCCWQCHSQLYFLNRKQHLLTICDDDHDDDDTVSENSGKVTLKKMQQLTPFGMLQAEHTVSAVKPVKPEMHILNDFMKDDDELPCPTHVNTISLADSVISALLKPYLKESIMEEENSLPENPPKTEENSETIYKDSIQAKKRLKSVPTRVDDFNFLFDYIT